MKNSEFWINETLAYGWSIIKKLREPDQYTPTVFSDGIYRYLYIYDDRTHDSVLTIQAPTYYDLFRAAQGAWNAYVLMTRGF